MTPKTSDDWMNLPGISHNPVSAMSQPNVPPQPPIHSTKMLWVYCIAENFDREKY